MSKRVGIAVCCAAVMAALLMPGIAAAQQCEGYTGSSLIRRMGGPQAWEKGGVDSVEELSQLYVDRQGEIEQIMQDRGFGHLSEGLFAKLAAGDATDGEVAPGDDLIWMVYRGSDGGPVSAGPLCLGGNKTYDAYIVVVDEVTETKPGEPVCEVAVEGDCDAETLNIDASGSSESAVVSMDGEELFTGAESWSGEYVDSRTVDRTFTVSAEEVGTKTITPHVFIIPKVCGNLAYAGPGPQRSEPGESASCEETVELERCPWCELTVPEGDVYTRSDFEVGIDGYKNLTVTELTSDTAGTTPYTSPMRVKVPGTYTVHGEATNDSGKSATCEATLEVKPRWTFRPYLAAISPQGNRSRQEGLDNIPVDGVGATTVFNESIDVDSAIGLGAGLEYHFNDRVGLDGNLLIGGSMDANWMADTDNNWVADDDSLSSWALTLGPAFHLTPNHRVDWFVEPFVGLFSLDDATFSGSCTPNMTCASPDGTLTRSFDNGSEFGLGLMTGLDIPFKNNPRWGLHFGLRWMQAEFEDRGLELEVDPLIFGAGLKYDF